MKPVASVSPPSPAPQDELRQRLSRLVDGDASPDEAASVCGQWAGDACVREAWHEYHLIGDVLRSEELAAPAVHQADFLAQLRQRLQQEPAIVAPTPMPAPARRRRPPRWLGGAAIAAGFVAVAGVLVVSRVSEPGLGEAGPAIAQQAPADDGLRRTTAAAEPAPRAAASAAPVQDGQLIRDARIDQYFEAHRGMRSMPAAALPGGGLRNVEALAPAR